MGKRTGRTGQPPSSFRLAVHTDHRYICRTCAAVVENWQTHLAWHHSIDEHEHDQETMLADVADQMEDLTARARAEAASEITQTSAVRRVAAYWAHAWLEALSVLRVRDPGPRPAASITPSPGVTAGRAALQRMTDSGLIARTTGKAPLILVPVLLVTLLAGCGSGPNACQRAVGQAMTSYYSNGSVWDLSRQMPPLSVGCHGYSDQQVASYARQWLASH
jgi:hypothetical protein